jgi:hypothetical protein
MIEKESWISKQEPKPFDADENGKILAKVCTSEGYRTADFTPQWVVPVYTVSIKEYLENDKLVEWRHTSSIYFRLRERGCCCHCKRWDPLEVRPRRYRLAPIARPA